MAHSIGVPCGAPSLDRIAERLSRMGHPPVAPENPYWADKGLTFEDPDGRRVVLRTLPPPEAAG